MYISNNAHTFKESASYYKQGNKFSEFISNITGNLRELLQNNTTYTLFQTSSNYWHFQRFPSKLNYSFFRVHTKLTLLEGYYQTILTYWAELISNNIHTFTELGTNSSKPFFESFNGQLNRQKILKEKIPKKFEKLASHMKQIILQSTTLEFTWSLMYVWLAPSSPPIIKMKRKLRPPI